MPDNVTPMLDGAVLRNVGQALRSMESAISAAIDAAEDAGVPRGLVVGILHGIALAKTQEMLDNSE